MRCHADRTRAQSPHLPTAASPPAGGAAAPSETEKDDVYCPAKRPDSQMDGKSSVKSSPRVEPVFPFLDLKAQFDATAGAVAREGARPVLIDIRPDTFNLDPNLIEAAIGSRTRAILPVHLFGLPADLDPILEVADAHRLAVVEDAAQAVGACYRGRHVGSLGAAGCFSFYPSKNLGGARDGGKVTTNEPQLDDRLRLLRDHGGRQK